VALQKKVLGGVSGVVGGGYIGRVLVCVFRTRIRPFLGAAQLSEIHTLVSVIFVFLIHARNIPNQPSHPITITSVHHPQPPRPTQQPTQKKLPHTKPNRTKPNQNVNIILAHPDPLAHLLHHPLRAVVAGPEQKRSGGSPALGVQEAVPGVVEGVDAGARRRR
jgi:hypothetical protein